MRLWSLSPVYLDTKGLLAAWREGLLALAVLEGRTRGYRNHPQLIRFRAASAPAECAVRYLEAVANDRITSYNVCYTKLLRRAAS